MSKDKKGKSSQTKKAVSPPVITPDPHRVKSVKKIRRILIKMGFDPKKVQIQGATEAGPDIIVTYEIPKGQTLLGRGTSRKQSLSILVQCKCSDEGGTIYKNLNTLIRVYESYIKEFKADIALLTLEGYSIPKRYKSVHKIDEVRKKGIVYWDNETLEYYKRIANALRAPNAQYTFLNDIGYRIRLSEKPIVVRADRIRQHAGGKQIWTFSLSAEKLLRIAYVFHRGSVSPEAYQRLLSSSRIAKVGKFVAERDNMLMNNVVVAFEEPVQYSKGRLKIPQITCSVWIIDGQHRLFGFLRLPEGVDREHILRNFNLVVAAIRGGRGSRGRRSQAKLFREINEFQRKIERNLLLDLYHYLKINDKNNILTRIDIAKRLRKTAPFKGRLRILPTHAGKVTFATIVDYKPFTRIVNEYGKKAHAICKAYFEKVSEIFEEEWNDHQEYVLCTNKGVRMLLSLLYRILRHNRNIGKKNTPSRLANYLRKLKKSTEAEPAFFLNKTYSGRALGAGAPDKVSTSVWATRIHEKVRGFLTPKELEEVFLGDARVLERLESTLRNCLRDAMGDDYFNKIPQDIRKEAIRRRKREAKALSWKKMSEPPESYLNFAAYRSVLTSKRRWDKYFKEIFPSKPWIEVKLTELEIIRNMLQHFRPLSQADRAKLDMYAKEISGAYEKWFQQQKAQASQSAVKVTGFVTRVP